MGWFPTKEQIAEEASDFENLGFFKKTKNVLVTFILGSGPINLIDAVMLAWFKPVNCGGVMWAIFIGWVKNRWGDFDRIFQRVMGCPELTIVVSWAV
jgi:hypothetical protein